MKKVLTLLGFAVCTWLPSAAQPGAGPDEVEAAAIQWPLDSLVFHFNFPAPDPAQFDSVALNKYHFPSGVVPTYTPAETAQRIKDLGSAIPFEYNSDVQAFIDLYTLKRREQVSRMLGLQHVFFPMIEQELDRQGMPLEIKYLPVVESALNPHAVSRAGATGLWQFMLATGKLYQLDVTSFVDERRDPVKSTEAAIRYLKNMYNIYGDWLLCIAAYNCGPGNVNRAIARAGGGKKTFWEISQYLPRETRGYVPAFIAANYVFHYSAEHNIYPRRIDFSYAQDTVMITRQQITLQQVAEATGADFYMLSDLNPELKTHTIPYSAGGYPLRVPHQTAMIFVMYRDSVYKAIAAVNYDTVKSQVDHNEVSPLTRNNYNAPKAPGYSSGYASATSDPQSGTVTSNGIMVYHTVRSGDIVSVIAQRYWVSAQQVAAWNGLSNYRIWPGQKLKIYVSEKRAAQLGISTPKAEAPVQGSIKPVQEQQQEEQKAQQQEDHAGTNGSQAALQKVYYRVQPGDTLWDIANKYEGLTVDKLKTMNGLGNSSALQVGQVLVVKCGEC